MDEKDISTKPDKMDPHFYRLLKHIEKARNVDFKGYKTSSLRRRIEKRLSALNILSFEAYIDYLMVHPAEYSRLLDSVLINVSSFFRDAPTWKALETEVLR